MTLNKLINTASKSCPFNDYCSMRFTIDLQSTYKIGLVEVLSNRGQPTWKRYSVDCQNYTDIVQYGFFARCFEIGYQGDAYGNMPPGTSVTVNVYEQLYTVTLATSANKTVVPPNSSFIISGMAKDQYGNPMSGQKIDFKIYKGTGLFSTAATTTDSSGNFSKEIFTGGWMPDVYKVDVISDDITQSVNVTVVYMSSAKFDAICTDTGLACPANVYIEGILKGITPVTVDNLPVGEHSYKVSRDGYSDVTGTVNIQQGVIAEISVPLTPAAKGSIFFNSVPVGAEIFLDDTDQGLRTPYNIEEVPVGVHSYILKLSGFKDYEGTVPVEANITSTVDVELTPGEGCIYFATSIPGAKIFVDNVDTGQVTPALVCGLSLGTHTYRLSLTGYQDITGNVNLAAGQGTKVTVTLERKFGSISFVSTPSGAQVFLDGQDQGMVTPATLTNVPIGSHAFTLKFAGYNDYTGTVEVLENQISTVSTTLTPAEGCIYFNTTPAGAKIFIDDVDTGKVTPALICGLSLGSHTYRLELSGYAAVTGTTGIGAGQGVVVASVLTPVEKGIGAGTLIGLTVIGIGVVYFATRKRG